MRAVQFARFGERPEIVEVDRPDCPVDGVIVRVAATGLCRSDWHAWQGHDADVTLPHIPGHEFAGVIDELGDHVTGLSVGDRVTAPFIFACGTCADCRAGATQVCPRQQQPGSSLAGSFAEFVRVEHAALNLVPLPDEIGFTEAAGLGCRFATAFHAVRDRANLGASEWAAVFGAGGVGLSIAMVVTALGARVIVVDPSPAARAFAERIGAVSIDASDDAPQRIRDLTDGGAHVSFDAFGSRETCRAAIASLRRRGRHVQVGLLAGGDARDAVPMARVIAEELDIVGSHGIAVSEYAALLGEVVDGRLNLSETVGRTIGFEDLPAALADLQATPASAGMTVAVMEERPLGTAGC